MDVNQTTDAIRAANDLIIPAPGGARRLRDLGETDLQWLAETRGKSPALVAGRRALKVKRLIDSLIEDLQRTGAAAPPQEPRFAPTAPRVQQDQLSIVPFVSTQAPDPPLPRPPLRRPAAFSLPPWVAELIAPYRKWLWLLITFLKWSPCLVHALLTFWLVMALWYIASNPGVIVTGSFAVIDLVPNYMAFVSNAMYDQARIEVKTRLR